MSKSIPFLALLFFSVFWLFGGCGDQTPTGSNRGAPGVPYSPTPPDSAIDLPGEVTMSWICIDPEDDPLTYDVHFGTTEVPPRILINHAQRSYTVTGLNYNQTYYWKIVAYDDQSHLTVGPVWRFKTGFPPNQPPAAPASPIPADSAAGVDVNVILHWTGFDPEGDTLRYNVYFGYTPFPPQVSYHQTQDFFDPPDLAVNRSYYWKIVAFDPENNYAEGPLWMFTTGGPTNQPPAAPSNPSPPDSSIERPIDVDLSWTCSEPEGEPLRYDVYFGGSVYPPEVSHRQPEAAYDPGVLTLNKTYYWKVVAHDTSGHSTESPLWRFTTTTIGNHPPESPSQPHPTNGVAFQPVDVHLSWICADPDGDPLTYDIFFSGSPELILVSEDADTAWYNPGELLNGRTYYWKIIARDNHGAATEGLIWRFITEEESGTPVPPAGPSNLRAEAAAPDRVNLTWQDNSVIEDGFLVERKDGDAGVWAQIAELPANAVSHRDATVEAERVYLYRVRAFNASGPSVYSNSARATTSPWPLLPPQHFAAQATGQDRIRLTWRDSTHSEDGISIERKISGGLWGEIARLAPNAVSHVDAGLAVRTVYYYRSRMWIGEEYSEYSAEASAVTFDVPPAAPSNLTAQTAGGADVQLAWQDNSNNESGFEIQRRLENGDWAALNSTAANVTQFLDDQTESYTTYYYRVRAFHEGGFSDFSNEAFAATPYVGRIVVVAAGAEGALTLELDENNQADLAGSLRLADEARGVAVRGAYALIAAHGAGLAVVDVSDPFNLRLVAALNIGDQAQSILVNGDLAYISARGSLVIADVSDPQNPSVVGSVNLPDWGRDVALDADNHIAYVAVDLECLVAIDVSLPSQPSQIGHLAHGVRARGVAYSAGNVFLAADTDGLLVVNVSEPNNPTLRGSDTTPGGHAARDVLVEGGMAYVAYGSAGLQVFNIGDLDHPFNTGDFTGPSNAAGVAKGFSALLLVNQGQPGLYIIDYSTPTDPDLIDSDNLPGGGGYGAAVLELNR